MIKWIAAEAKDHGTIGGNLSWKIEDDELIIINEIGGEWTETFKIDISAETATSTRTGIVYQIHEMESPLE